MHTNQRKKQAYLASVYLEYIPVEADSLEEAIKLVKKEVFRNGLEFSIEATISEEDIAREQAGEEIKECEEDYFQWNILEDLAGLFSGGRN
jgi:hypothetical protein